MKMIWMAGSLFLLSIPAMAQSSSAMRGFWYTEGTEHGIHLQFLEENRADGTFIKKIRNVTNCRNPESQTETGHWSFKGSRLKLVTETIEGEAVNAADPEYIDFFEMSGGNKRIAMYDLKTKITWQWDKVPSDFKMPPGDGCGV